MGRDDQRDRDSHASPSPPPNAPAERGDPPLQASARRADVERGGTDAEPERPRPTVVREPIEPRRFDLRATPRPVREPDPPARRAARLVATALAALALLLVATARGLVLRAALPVALAFAALGVLLRGRRAPLAARDRDAPPPSPPRSLTFSAAGLEFHGSAEAPLFSAAPPFGLTLVTSRARDRLVAAITSSQGAFYVGCALPPALREASASLLARASIVGDEEVGLEAVGPDGEPVELPATDLVAVVRDLVRADPTCLERCVLTDARGAPVVLEGRTLRVRGAAFDLTAPLEWRALVFQEAFGQAVAIYQGSWVRQGAAEAVLVSLLPAIESSAWKLDAVTGIPELDRAALRDLRLARAAAESPPPIELRVAIDRLFMMPLRGALDRAPKLVGRARP
jgi:hypothetical protein